MTTMNLPYHVQRTYLVGDNSISFGWALPSIRFQDETNQLLEREHLDVYDKIRADRENKEAYNWSDTTKRVFVALRILFPPYSAYYHKQQREIHFN